MGKVTTAKMLVTVVHDVSEPQFTSDEFPPQHRGMHQREAVWKGRACLIATGLLV